MVTLIKDQSTMRKLALTAGISLIIMAAAAFFSNGFVHGSLVQSGDASGTFHNIQASHSLFKAEILGWIIILVCDIVVAWALYLLMKPIHPGLSLLGAWLRLVYAAILGIAVMRLIDVLLLTDGTGYLSLLTSNQLQGQVMLELEAFEKIWSIGLIVFGGHILMIGWIALKWDRIPKIISLFLLAASIGYVVIHLFNILIPQYKGIIIMLEYIFIVPMIAGELGLGLWLLFKRKGLFS